MKKVIIFLFLCLTSNVWGQSSDTCQCRLIYGTWLNSTLVTFHHDSFVSYQYSRNPKDTIKNIIRNNGYKDTVFFPEFYDWSEFKETYSIRNGNIGNKIDQEFFTEIPEILKDTNQKIKTYYIRKLAYWSDSLILAAKETSFKERLKINDKICNCYNFKEYKYSGDFNKIKLTFQNLNSVNFTNNSDSIIENTFVFDDSHCNFSIFDSKNCYLPGIGLVSLTSNLGHPFPKEIKLNIVYLTRSCKEYLSKRFQSN